MISSLYLSGRLALSQGDPLRARSLAEQGLALSREVGDRWSTGQLLSLLGAVAAHQGNLATARALYQESLALGRGAGRKVAITASPHVLAGVSLAASETIG